MTLTPDELAAIVAVLIALAGALANYLNHLSNVKQIEVLHTKVDAVSQAVAASPPATVTIQPASSILVDGHLIEPKI